MLYMSSNPSGNQLIEAETFSVDASRITAQETVIRLLNEQLICKEIHIKKVQTKVHDCSVSPLAVKHCRSDAAVISFYWPHFTLHVFFLSSAQFYLSHLICYQHFFAGTWQKGFNEIFEDFDIIVRALLLTLC